MAVLNEVQIADAVDVDRGHRVTSLARRSNPLPSGLQAAGPRAKHAVELVCPPADCADDRFQSDLLHADVVYCEASDSRHHFVE